MCGLLQHRVIKRSIKWHVLAVLWAFCAFQGKAYGQSADKADAYYAAQQYHVAAELYSRILAADSAHYHAAWRLAHCQRELFAYEAAEKHFGHVAKHAAGNFPASVFYYAEALKRKQDYPAAIRWYDRYLALAGDKQEAALTEKARYEREICREAMLSSSAGRVPEVGLARLPEPVNTPYQEFAPVIYQHDSVLVFSSSRLGSGGTLSNRSGQRFSDQYLVHRDSASWREHEKHQRFTRLNSGGSEASGSFTADASQYYFTRCSEKGGNCRVFMARQVNGRWQSPQPLPEVINQPGTNTKHPMVTASGDSLFFVSDRPGGMGKGDIWLSVADHQENWQKAMNLGPRVNSPQDEIFPYYYGPERLFIFGSEGRDGPGGMDLYMIHLEAGAGTTAIPLKSPFNSTHDDCCLVFGQLQGYVASNRDGNFDIYSFTKAPDQRLSQLLMGIIPISGSQLAGTGQAYDEVITDYSLLLDNEMEYLNVMHSDEQHYLSSGSSRFVLSADVNDIRLEQLRDEKALSRDETSAGQARVADTLAAQRILASFSTRQISRDEQVEINGKVRNASNFREVSALRLYLLNQEGEVIKITTTNQYGAFRFINLQAAASYQIVNAGDTADQDYLLTYDVSSYGDEVQTLKFENIYFDFNQAALRNEARVALDELVNYYRQHPTSVIEINAFTDTTGNDVYNLQLSRERGLVAFDYLLEAGVDRSSLVINARGASTTASSSNAFVSQQLNRRVELSITGKGLVRESEIVTRMLRPQVTLFTLSSRTGMSLEDIRRLNGITGDELQAYKPVRLFAWAVQRAPSLFYQTTVRSEE